MNSINDILSILNEKEIEFKIGNLKNFLDTDPQKYFNLDIAIETYKAINAIDEDTFIDNFEEIKDYFFSFINSYYHVVDIYNELDDISFDSEVKIKIYYLPIITQIIENVFSNFYRVATYFIGTNKKATMLNHFKESLKGKLDSSLNEIDINFRNSISHGKVSINGSIMFYTYSDKSVKPYRDKTEQINLNQIENLKNKLLDTSSAVFLAFMLYLNKIDLFENIIFKNKDDSYTNNELLKLYLKSEKIEVKNINTKCNEKKVFEIFVYFKNIQTIDEIINISNQIIKVLSQYFISYDYYLVHYSNDYSPGGTLIFNNILELDSNNSLINDIEKIRISPKSYKYHNFKEIKNDEWEVKNISDFSIEKIKRLKGKLFIKNKNISNEELKKIFYKTTKEVRQLSTLQNPADIKAKYIGDADIVYLNVFYDNLKRINYGHEELSNNFICNLTYYRTKTTHIPDYPFQNIHLKEDIPKHVIWWKNDEANT